MFVFMEKEYRDMIENIKAHDLMAISEDVIEVKEKAHYRRKSESIQNKDRVPLLSVIIPTYKRSQLLRETLLSIINQRNFENYEVVVVDSEGYEDRDWLSDTERVIQEIDDSRIIYYQNERNVSGGITWNLCLALARGKWVCMVHDDDILLPGYFEKMYKQICKYPFIDFLGCINYSFEKQQDLKKIRTNSFRDDKVKNINYEEFMYGLPVSLLGAFFKRDNAIKIGGFDRVSQIGDYVFTAKYSYYYNTYIYKCPLYGYRISMNQDSANNKMNFIRRIADYYLWVSIAKRRKGRWQKLYLKNCQYNIKNRIEEYNKQSIYGAEHYIDIQQIYKECEIDETKMHASEYYFCKVVHAINYCVMGMASKQQ